MGKNRAANNEEIANGCFFAGNGEFGGASRGSSTASGIQDGP